MPQPAVTVLTGYLGAGKTTLLNRILSEPHGHRYVVIVNEFGAIGIDADLIVGADDDVVEMTNGCLCCNVRGDLIGALEAILKRPEPFDGILIETSGLADPAPIAATFLLDDDLSDAIRLDAIVTVVDARHVLEQLDEGGVAASQLALADVIVLNKSDLVGAEDLKELEERLRHSAPWAGLNPATRCDVPLDAVLGRKAFDLAAALERNPGLLAPHAHRHDGGIASVALATGQPIDADAFMDWIGRLRREKGRDLLRAKGIVAFAGEHRRFVFHGVQTLFEGDVTRLWRDDEARESRIVFIGRGLDPRALEHGFEACFRPDP